MGKSLVSCFFWLTVYNGQNRNALEKANVVHKSSAFLWDLNNAQQLAIVCHQKNLLQ